MIFPRKGATYLSGVQTFLMKREIIEASLMGDYCQEMGSIKGNIKCLGIINTKGINKVLQIERVF